MKTHIQLVQLQYNQCSLKMFYKLLEECKKFIRSSSKSENIERLRIVDIDDIIVSPLLYKYQK